MFASWVIFTGGSIGGLAALNSFLIAYDEAKARRSKGWKLWRTPLYCAAATFAGFFAISFAMGGVIPKV